jgi:FHA domain
VIGMQAARRLVAVATLCALVTALVAAVAGADAGVLSSVAVGRVRVDGDRTHRVWVSAVDDLGMPITGLRETAFQVSEDAGGAEGLEVESWPGLYDRLHVTLVLDADLFEKGNRRALSEVVRTLGEAAGRGGHLRVVVVGARARALESEAANAADLASRLLGLEVEREEPRLYDALFSEVGTASRLPGRTGRAVVVVARGTDAGSRQGVVEILAIAGQHDHPTPVLVALLTDPRGAPEAERLTRLGMRSGGAVARVRVIDDLGSAVDRLVARTRGSYRLSFRPLNWNPKLDRHELRVAVTLEGQVRSATATFETDDVVAASWWQRPAPWLWLGVMLAGAAAALLALRRRPLFVLYVESGEEEGYRYEVYATPLTLGAAAGNDVTFHEPRLSRNHSVVDRRGSGIEITDLNSENGTFVNGERVTRRSLADGDQISLGQTVELTFDRRA